MYKYICLILTRLDIYWLFNGNIRENIAYGKEVASEEEIVAAAKIANVHYFITTLAEGYDMILSEEANDISQSEK